MRSVAVRLSFILALVLVSAAPARSDQAPDTPPAAPTGLSAEGGAAAPADAAMAEMMKYATPGPNHQLLEAMVGDWNTTSKMWMGPGEPATSTGISIHRFILGGRFLEQRYNGTMMGQPYEGYGLTGFDNRKGRFVSVWVDNTMTEMALGQGSWDASTKSLTVVNSITGPDGKPTTMRTVTVLKDADTHVFTMYVPMNGQETKMAEMTYTRRK